MQPYSCYELSVNGSRNVDICFPAFPPPPLNVSGGGIIWLILSLKTEQNQAYLKEITWILQAIG